MFSDVPWLLVLAGFVLLTVGGECLVRGAARLARRAGVPPVIIGSTFVAFGTASPVLFVSVSASHAGRGDIAVASVVGFAIATIGCILAVCAMVLPLRVSAPVVRRAMPAAVIAALAASVVLADGRLGTAEAALLLAGLGIHGALTVRQARREQTLALREDYASSLPPPANSALPEVATVAAGLVMLAVGARLMVEGAASLAHAADVSDAVAGLTIVAFSSSLPVFSTALVATFRRQPDIAVGTLVGAGVFSMLGALGAAGLAAPLRAYDLRALDFGAMVGFAVLLLPFLKTGFRLQRWQGALLLTAYAVYLVRMVH